MTPCNPRVHLLNLCIKPLKHSVLFFALCFFMAAFSVNAAESAEDFEKVMQRMFDEKGQGWLCYWELYLPDRLPGADANIVPGMRGFADIEFETGNIGTDIEPRYNDFIIIRDFADGKVLRIMAGAGGKFRPTEFSVTPWTGYSGDFKESVFITSTTLTYHNNGREATYPTILEKWQTSGPLVFTSANANQAVARTNPQKGPFLMIYDWDGSTESVKNCRFGYFESLTLRFIKVSEDKLRKATMKYSVGGKQYSKSFHVVAEERNDGAEEIHNPFNLGSGFYGDVFDYIHSESFVLPDYASPALQIDDADVKFSSPFLPILSLSYLSQKLNYDQKLIFEMGDQDNGIWYTNYLIMSAVQFAKLDIPEKSEYRKVEGFYNEIMNNLSPESHCGHINIAENDLPNLHWDRGNKTTSRHKQVVEFKEHYILPIRFYHCNNERFHREDYFDYLFRPDKDALMKIDSFTFDYAEIETLSESLEFILKEYGKGTIGEEEGQPTYLYIHGDLTATANYVTVMLARGRLDDYEAAKLNDTEKGHVDALVLTGSEYEINGPAALADTSGKTTLRYLIPETALAGDTEADEYTLFAKYSDTEGYPHFRTLVTLNSNNQTSTHATDIISSAENPYTLTDNGITAHERLDIYDMTGRRVATLSAGQHATMNPGLYLARTPNRTLKLRK